MIAVMVKLKCSAITPKDSCVFVFIIIFSIMLIMQSVLYTKSIKKVALHCIAQVDVDV